MCAAAEGRVECVRLLLDAGADNNAKNKVRLGFQFHFQRQWMELYFDFMVRWNIDSLVGVHRQQLCVRPDWESEIRECLDGGGTTESREQK
jgi:hypothetical protein